MIMNTLIKDKEISDRWRKFADVADSRHLANRVEREVVDALVAAVTDAYPRLSHRYYALKARWFGKPQLDHWDRNAPLPDAPSRVVRLERGARHGARRLSRLFAAHGRHRAALLRRRLDRRAAAARQGAGRLRPSDDAVGAPLRAGQLSRQAARRDDARARARPRRPSGARRAQRRADGADAADARRDRLGVRRDADLPRAARFTPPIRRCAEAMLAAKVEDMLNTVVRQIAFYTFERRVHLERRAGELTPEAIGAAWMSVQGESLGPAIRLGPGYETFWAYIGHFIHSPFYVYAYAFGDCLVNSLYGVYERAPGGLRRTLSGDARGRRLQAARRAARAVRPRRARPGLLGHRAVADRADDRRTRGARLRRRRGASVVERRRRALNMPLS